MELHILPAPIAYVRHLVDVEDDERAKFDQLRVLAQNTLQFMASILVNDCHRLGLIDHLPTPIPRKKLVVGDFFTLIVEASNALMPVADNAYVPQLVRLYGDLGKAIRQRKTRLQRVVESRNRDAHAASLAQTAVWLRALRIDMDEILEELVFLRSYALIAVKNLEMTPDRRTSLLNGVRCHGFAERYTAVNLPISQTISRCEVILVKPNSTRCLSLRPWLLYLNNGPDSIVSVDELALLNSIDARRLEHIGLVSGEIYSPENEWRTFTVYAESEAEKTAIPTRSRIESSDNHSRNKLQPRNLSGRGKLIDEFGDQIRRLAETSGNIAIQPDSEKRSNEYFVSVRTPTRDVPVATIDPSGIVWIYPRSLKRALFKGSVDQNKDHEVLQQLRTICPGTTSLDTAILKIGHISECVVWLGNLARSLST